MFNPASGKREVEEWDNEHFVAQVRARCSWASQACARWGSGTTSTLWRRRACRRVLWPRASRAAHRSAPPELSASRAASAQQRWRSSRVPGRPLTRPSRRLQVRWRFPDLDTPLVVGDSDGGGLAVEALEILEDEGYTCLVGLKG